MGAVSEPLIQWFELNRRLLPFRQEPSAYHIWVSEIMLQQTRVSAALPYYERFVAELPDPAALAACDPDKLRKLWQGLGYYSRVANMQKAAQIVCRQYGGQLPADYAALRALPGIGDYTAGAIASIAFGIPAPAVDGNVLRVFARLDNNSADITKPAAKREFTARVLEEMPKERPGPYNEALMELGALVCLPNGAPLCEQCPLGTLCRARAAGTALSLPQKTPPKARRITPVTVALVLNEDRVLLQQRPAKGLLGGRCCGRIPPSPPQRPPPALLPWGWTAQGYISHPCLRPSTFSPTSSGTRAAISSLCRNSPPPQAASGPERSSWRLRTPCPVPSRSTKSCC